MDGWILPALLLGGWLAAGATIGVRLERAGAAPSTAVSALVAWPLLLPLLSGAPLGAGPLAARIHDAFARLAEAMADPVAAEPPWGDELDRLRDSLLAADARIAMVDRLLRGEADGTAASELRLARQHAVDEVEAVLSGLSDLRLQLGLYALDGGAVSIRDELRSLQARASALSEVRSVQRSS